MNRNAAANIVTNTGIDQLGELINKNTPFLNSFLLIIACFIVFVVIVVFILLLFYIINSSNKSSKEQDNYRKTFIANLGVTPS